RKDLPAFRNMRYPKMWASGRRYREQVDTLEPDRARHGRQSSRDRLEKSCFAGSVRPDDRDELTFADAEADPIQHRNTGIPGCDVLNFEHGPSTFCRDRPR